MANKHTKIYSASLLIKINKNERANEIDFFAF